MRDSGYLSNYEIQIQKGARLFLGYDQERIIEKYQLKADEAYLYVDYLQKTYRIRREDGVVEEPQGLGNSVVYHICNKLTTAMTIYDMLCFSPVKEPVVLSDSWCPVSKFYVLRSSPDPQHFTQFYAEFFSGKTKELSCALKALGGICQKNIAGADLVFEIPVFPFFPVRMQFWDKDEEFPPKIVLLWNGQSKKYLHFETTFYLQQDLLVRLKELMTGG